MRSKILFLGLTFMLSCATFSMETSCTNPENPIEMKQIEGFQCENLAIPVADYFLETTAKKQIVLHHTASGVGISGDMNEFLKPGRIATHYIIGADTIYQLFKDQYWSYHLGVQSSLFKKHKLPYINLNKTSIGIEIDNWGKLLQVNGEFRAWPNDYGRGTAMRKGQSIKVVIPSNEVVEYAKPFRDSTFYQKYTDWQIRATKHLVSQLAAAHNIPLNYNEDMWDLSLSALKNKPGVWTHVSFRPDKSDCHPQPEMIAMLKSLNC